MQTILVTGGCGFIGSNFVRYVLAERPDYHLVNLDLLTYAGNPENLEDLADDPRYRFVHGDICDGALVRRLLADGAGAVINFAAESHVDRSIHAAGPFVRTNVTGTSVLLEAAREAGVSRSVQVLTDEVYGSLGPTGAFTEETPLAPNSPYAASKAAADLLVRAYVQTFGFPGIITRCSNNFGPYQFPEKLIPLFLANALEDRPLPLYGDGLNVRDWIFVEDHCAAILLIFERGIPGEVYNIGGGHEVTNLEITRRILAELGKPETLIRYVTDRPGHDRRYAIDASKLRRELGWQPAHAFAGALQQTVQWYLDHRAWSERVRSGAYREFYRQQYGPEIADEGDDR